MRTRIYNEARQKAIYKCITDMLNNNFDEHKVYVTQGGIITNEFPLSIEEKRAKIIDLIKNSIEKESKTIGTAEFVDYVIENLKQKKYLNIWGRGHSLMLWDCEHNNHYNIFRSLEDLKREYVDCTSLSSLQDKETQTQVPEVLDTPEIQEIFKKAISKGLMTERYEWLKEKQLLAYFAEKISLKFSLSKMLDKDGKSTISWKPFERLFNESDLKGAKQNWMRLNTKFEPNGFEEVDFIL